MKMDKLFAGLIAFAAGVALSAGSAFAVKGYTVGDPAKMKLVPYYETGDTRATIIGIQNLAGISTDTQTKRTAVDTAKAALIAAEDATPPDPTTIANAKTALERAEAAHSQEHMVVTVKVYDRMGMMMDDASVNLCLKEDQFGYVVLQGPASMMAGNNQEASLSVEDGDIPEYGYAIIEGGSKYTGCGFGAKTITPAGGNSEIAAWTIIQDTGEGFFGTEVPTATISMGSSLGADGTAGTADDGDPELGCYGGAGGVAATNTTAPDITGDFNMEKCGLIPERRNMGAVPFSATDSSTTIDANAFARYDTGEAAMNESMVYVWLGAGMDTENTRMGSERMLDVVVKCEDGTVEQDANPDGSAKPIKVPAPDMVTMIDPLGDALMDFTDKCEGDRGMLQITMPRNSRAGAVFSHVTQLDGHYRMNFPGYGAASTTLCTAADNETGDNVDDCR